MSDWMSIRAKRSPTAVEILEAVATPELRSGSFPEGLPSDFWPTGVVHYYRAGHSARGVELTLEPDLARVQMLCLSNPEDWELGFRLLRALAADPAAQVEGQDGTVSSLSDMRERFLEVLHRRNARDFESIRKQVLDHPHPDALASMNGPIREVFIGRRCFAELSTETTEAVPALIERIRRIQYIESEGFDVPQPKELAAVPGVMATPWEMGKAQAFVATDYVALEQPWRRITVCVPVREMPSLAGSRFQWLDERQFILQPIPESERAALHEQAASKVAIHHRRKRWWQFWK